ncbi:glycosyltransferase family 2 protein [Noviherbaspirillum sp.]|uniref:glycosyltransferase family 2 protein n=1 Tax=Noviherbaspirillum sp. TaxID=1926288 RepID=UPI002FE0B7DE
MASIQPININLIVPCYNEEAVLPETSRQLLAMLGKLQVQGRIDGESRVTFVDDGSRDRTWQMIEELSRQDARVHGIKLSRNQGHQNALLAGLLSARGDVLVSLDADLQDDIDAIPRMLDEYERGADIVYGVRARRDTDTVFKRWTARAYYGLLRKFGVDIVPDHADFRLMSRRSLDALRDFREVNLFLRGIIPMLGFRTAIVTYDRLSRFAGESKYPVLKMLALALNGIFSFSTVPLQWITVFGFILSAASMAIGIWALFIRFATTLAIPGWASTVIPMYFLGGLQLLALGIIGGYLSRIYSETKQRPRFIIEKSI